MPRSCGSRVALPEMVVATHREWPRRSVTASQHDTLPCAHAPDTRERNAEFFHELVRYRLDSAWRRREQQLVVITAMQGAQHRIIVVGREGTQRSVHRQSRRFDLDQYAARGRDVRSVAGDAVRYVDHRCECTTLV